jgi:hypothetical protein
LGGAAPLVARQFRGWWLRPTMSIENLTDDQLERFAANYRRSRLTEGGKYSLSEILLEQRRRAPSPFETREVAARIIELGRQSCDGFLTYGELWHSFRPNSPWSGRGTQQIVAQCLYRVIGYCVRHKLPIVTVLVVRGANRQLSAEAVQNIYNECRELDVDTGLNAEAFVKDQIKMAKALTLHDLPGEGT